MLQLCTHVTTLHLCSWKMHKFSSNQMHIIFSCILLNGINQLNLFFTVLRAEAYNHFEWFLFMIYRRTYIGDIIINNMYFPVYFSHSNLIRSGDQNLWYVCFLMKLPTWNQFLECCLSKILKIMRCVIFVVFISS